MMEQIQHNPSYNEVKHSSTPPSIVIGGKNTLSTTPRMPFTSSQGLSSANRQDARHVLQDCPQLDDARLKYWPEPREMNQKLYGSALQLRITVEFIYASDLTI
ncbi:hypothetical protein ElyMa_001079200 [Elysia marginata]|uniref:Uncharacterized protein n=1 Tax=Elysia marginata TaxID=1093978 RepID=A0AAV4HS49_9GAST|nr:hypothetical protein ElyMa_001079200 [Elysia marginata]